MRDETKPQRAHAERSSDSTICGLETRRRIVISEPAFRERLARDASTTACPEDLCVACALRLGGQP